MYEEVAEVGTRGSSDGLMMGGAPDCPNFQPSAIAAFFHRAMVGIPKSSINVCTMRAIDKCDSGFSAMNAGGR